MVRRLSMYYFNSDDLFQLNPLVPEGVPAPLVTNGVGDTVLVSWTPPSSPNGVILRYYVERAFSTTEDRNFTMLGVVEASNLLVYVDSSTVPFTGYMYRIVAENSVGGTAGPPTEFMTPEAGVCVCVCVCVLQNVSVRICSM